jgi:hypothetical protein
MAAKKTATKTTKKGGIAALQKIMDDALKPKAAKRSREEMLHEIGHGEEAQRDRAWLRVMDAIAKIKPTILKVGASKPPKPKDGKPPMGFFIDQRVELTAALNAAKFSDVLVLHCGGAQGDKEHPWGFSLTHGGFSYRATVRGTGIDVVEL